MHNILTWVAGILFFLALGFAGAGDVEYQEMRANHAKYAAP